MVNACFRCKRRIDSGETFCRSCHSEVSLDFSYTSVSRLWLLVALSVVVQVGAVVAWGVQMVLSGTFEPIYLALAATGTLPLLMIGAMALIYDARHVGKRDDTDWDPSGGVSWVLGALLLTVVLAPFVAGYYLYKRRATIGLAIRSS